MKKNHQYNIQVHYIKDEKTKSLKEDLLIFRRITLERIFEESDLSLSEKIDVIESFKQINLNVTIL